MMIGTGLNYSDGLENPEDGRTASTPIYASPGDVLKTNFVSNSNLWNFFVVYNANGEKIRHAGLSNNGTITLNNDASYIRLAIQNPRSVTVTNMTTGEVIFKWSLN
jgi:hypothetical protein